MSTILTVLQVLGCIASFCLYLSPIPTCIRIAQNGTTGDFPVLPYFLSLYCCLASVWYTLPFITAHAIVLCAISGTGALLYLVYIIIYVLYAPVHRRRSLIAYLFLGLLVLATYALLSYYAVNDNEKIRHIICGTTTSLISVVAYMSPLFVVVQVYRTRSVESMPFFPSLFIFVEGLLWLAYGILRMDYFIMFTNGCGALMGMLQLILYAIYWKPTPIEASRNQVNQPSNPT